MRKEVLYPSLEGTETVSWDEAISRWRSWYEEQREMKTVVENSRGERTGFRTPNRFTPEYREMLYAKAQSLERSLRERWGRLLHTGMVTLTASSTTDEGRPRPPVEHLEDLLSSWEAVRRALSRVLDGRDWEYLAIIEPHSSGYAHVHLGVFVKGPVAAEQFRPVLDAHIRNCEGAKREAHQVYDAEKGEYDAVAVHRTADRTNESGIENLGAYLASYMAGEYATEATAMPAHVQAFYAVMWSTGRQWWRPSNGAQKHMKPPEDDEDDEDDEVIETWRLVGISPSGDLDEDVIEVDPAASRRSVYGRVRYDTTGPPPRG